MAKAEAANRASSPRKGQTQQRRAAPLLPGHAAHPPLRGEGGPALRHGPDRRLLPSLYRPGSRRRRHAGQRSSEGDQVITAYRDHGHMLACGMDPGRRHGRTHRPQRRLLAAARAARCTCSAVEKNFFGGHGIVGAQVPARHRPRASPTSTAATTACADLFRRRRGEPGPSVRELQHGRALEAAGHLHHREQPVRDGHLGASARAPRPISTSAASRSTFRASEVDGMDIDGGARRRRRRR